MIVMYKVSPLMGIRMDWVTEITHVKDGEFFVDEQRYGPYRMWHHEHNISEVGEGVLMEDIITYQPPFGFLGDIANGLIIKGKLDEIFDFRFRAMEREFG